MEFNKFIELLINSNFIRNMDKKDNEFFINNINTNKEFNNYNYYITKYNLTKEDTNLINKYNFHIYNFVENMIVILDN
jgi:hypothetical protein